MAVIVYSAQAKLDLFEINGYIAERNPHAADGLLSKIYHSCEQLKDFPLSGQLRADVRTEMRHRVIDNYLILYRAGKDKIEIVRIVHGSRYLPDLL